MIPRSNQMKNSTNYHALNGDSPEYDFKLFYTGDLTKVYY